jgi:hypothetical protein
LSLSVLGPASQRDPSLTVASGERAGRRRERRGRAVRLAFTHLDQDPVGWTAATGFAFLGDARGNCARSPASRCSMRGSPRAADLRRGGRVLRESSVRPFVDDHDPSNAGTTAWPGIQPAGQVHSGGETSYVVVTP